MRVEVYKELLKLRELIADRLIYVFKGESDFAHRNAEILQTGSGKLLVVNVGGEAWRELDIVKAGYYIVAIRAEGGAVFKIGNLTYNISSPTLDIAYIGPVYLAEGRYRIALRPAVIDAAAWNFTSADMVEEWRRYNSIGRLRWDPIDRSIQVNFPPWRVKVVVSPLIPAEGKYAYSFRLELGSAGGGVALIKAVERDREGRVLYVADLGSVEIGDSWKEVALSYTPKEGGYLQLLVVFQTEGDSVWIRHVHVYKYTPLRLDSVWIYSAESSTDRQSANGLFAAWQSPAHVVKFERVAPTLWTAKVVAERPFLLVFAESFDPMWEARVYKGGKLVEVVRPTPVNGLINGFWINEVGDLMIELRYVPQERFELGLKISLPAFVITVSYLAWNWRREKGDVWAIKVERLVKSALTWSRWSR